MPFLNGNDIALRPANNQVIFSDGSIHTYNGPINSHKTPTVSRASAYILKSPATTIWPGDYIELPVPPCFEKEELAVEPRIESNDFSSWPSPTITHAVACK